ncbi:GNAT family N-acetyltransferase [Myxococcota bacterium]|nr:GNAT family N-acetyltransferase [Myxococcota bacterium]MBU1413007.1 GNAT family N-acetyltransferase [Myxococcota bacterium]MBU1511544.1 GNAT family N-acetyltransferase [Myxococcota bacterium]
MIPPPYVFFTWNSRDKVRFRAVTELAQEAFLRFGEYREFIGRLMIREDVITGLLIEPDHPDDDLAGFIQVGLIPDEDGRVLGNILAIAIAPRLRFNSLGPVLMRWAIAQIQYLNKNTPMKCIQLTVAPDNEPAIRLFSRFGFTLVPEEIEHHYASGVRARDMSRPVFLPGEDPKKSG